MADDGFKMDSFFLDPKTKFGWERVETIRSQMGIYERRIKRYREEIKILNEFIESEQNIINKLGITPENLESILFEKNQINQSEEEAKKKTNENDDSTNFYNGIDSKDLLTVLKKCKEENRKIDFQTIFKDFPFITASLFDNECKPEVSKICEFLQTLDIEERKEFYSAVWNDLNSLPYFMNQFVSLVKPDNFMVLDEIVESTLAKILNFKHVVVYNYDQNKSTLSKEKQQFRFQHVLSNGIISHSLKSNKPIFVSKNDQQHLSPDDISVLEQHINGYFIPLPDISMVIALYDRIGKLTPFDDLIAKSFTNIINEIGLAILIKEKAQKKMESVQQMTQLFTKISSMSNIKNIVFIIQNQMTKIFNCEYANLFKVSHSSNVFSTIINENRNRKIYPVGYGIIGDAILRECSVKMTNPEVSLLFKFDSDRPFPNIKTNSILVCPIFENDSEGHSNVKYALALYNKIKTNTFTQDDMDNIEFLCSNLNDIILLIEKIGGYDHEIKVSDEPLEEYLKMVDLVKNINDFSDAQSIETQITKIFKANMDIDKADIFVIDPESKLIIKFGSLNKNDDNIYINSLNPLSKDPIVKYSLKNEICEETNDLYITIYSPLIGLNDNVTGILALSSKHLDSDSKESKLNDENKKIISFWSKIIGHIVEITYINQKTTQKILLEERLNESLSIFNNQILAYLYPRGTVNTTKSDDNFSNSQTNYIISPNQNENLISCFKDLAIILNSFPGKDKLFSFKKDTSTLNQQIISNNFFSKAFPKSNLFDVFSIDESTLFFSLLDIMLELNILDFFKSRFNFIHFKICMFSIRSMHHPKQFHNWLLSVDRVQFLYYFLIKTGLNNSLSNCQKTALFFYLLCMNCDPTIENGKLNRSPYFLENGKNLSVGVSIFFAFSSIPDSPFFSLSPEEQNDLFKCIKELDQTQNLDEILGNSAFFYTAIVCLYSYLGRNQILSENWVNYRFEEEFKDEERKNLVLLIKYQLEFEMNVVIQPTFMELERLGIDIEEIKNNFISNLKKSMDSLI